MVLILGGVLTIFASIFFFAIFGETDRPYGGKYGGKYKTGKPKTSHTQFGGEKKTGRTDRSQKRGRFEINRFEVLFRL